MHIKKSNTNTANTDPANTDTNTNMDHTDTDEYEYMDTSNRSFRTHVIFALDIVVAILIYAALVTCIVNNMPYGTKEHILFLCFAVVPTLIFIASAM